MEDTEHEVLANFMAISGCEDTAQAIPLLDATDWNLEEAVNLFFASGTGGSVGASGGGLGGPPGPAALDDDVRAPLPAKMERLLGGQADEAHMLARMRAGMGSIGPGQQAAVQDTLDVFRDFKAEGQRASAAGTSGSGGSAAGGSGDAAAGAQGGLSGLFALPKELHYVGTYDHARHQAETEGKWLLVNVQSPSEFASHRLNRDTWGDEILREVLKGTFVFYQVRDAGSPEGQRLLSAHRLQGSPPPIILVVDPITGAGLWHKTGFVAADKLMEDLVPYMDHGPTSAGAAVLAQQSAKRKAVGPSAPAPAGARAAAGGVLSEDEQLQMAIAMSMGQGQQGASGSGYEAGTGGSDVSMGAEDDDDLDEDAIWTSLREREAAAAAAAARKTPEQVLAEASGRLPPEPAESDPAAIRVALRMPDGSRHTRRFSKSDAVSALYDFCLTLLPEAAERKLTVSHSQPGAQPLSDMTQSLEAAGAAGAMLVARLSD